MDRFAPALRRVAAELDLPRGPRAAVRAGMAGDLEAIYERERRQGAAEDAAARKAEELVLGTSEVIRRLGRIHARPWRSWSEAVGSGLTGGVDLLLLVVGVLPMAAMSGAAAAVVLARGAGPAAWGLGAIGVVITGLIAKDSVRLARGAPVRSSGLSLLLGLSILAPVAGLLVLAVGGHQTALALSATASATASASAGADPEAVWMAAVGGLAAAGSTFLFGLLLGIAGSLAWFILLSRSSARVVREVEAMLAGAGDDGVVEPAPTLSLVHGGTQ